MITFYKHGMLSTTTNFTFTALCAKPVREEPLYTSIPSNQPEASHILLPQPMGHHQWLASTSRL